jgi:hypothetical protein
MRSFACNATLDRVDPLQPPMLEHDATQALYALAALLLVKTRQGSGSGVMSVLP